MNNIGQTQESDAERQTAAALPHIFPVGDGRRVTVDETGNVHPSTAEGSLPDDSQTVQNEMSRLAESHEMTLANSFLDTLKLHSSVEKKRPSLKTTSKKDYEFFRPKFDEYIKNGGTRSLAECMDLNAKNGYSVYFGITNLTHDYPVEKNDALLQLIEAHHGIDTHQELHALLNKHKMANKGGVLDADAVEVYVGEWATLYMTFATLRTADKNKFVADAFIKGLQPMVFRDAVKTANAQTFMEAVAAIKAESVKLRTVADYNARQQALDNKQNKKNAGKNKGSSSNEKAKPVSTSPQDRAPTGVAAAATKAPKARCGNCQLAGIKSSDHGIDDCPVTCYPCAHLDPPRFHQRKTCKAQAKQATQVANAAVAPPEEDDINSVSTVNDMLIDSGSNGIYVNQSAYISDLTSSVDRTRTIKVADGSSVPIEGQGLLVDIPCDFVPAFDNSLIGVSNLCCSGDICVFDSNKMHAIKTDSPVITQQYNNLIETAQQQNKVSMTATNIDGVYKTNYAAVQHCRANFKVSATTGTPVSTTTTPVAHSVIRFNSTEFKSNAEMVQYFHESWNHASVKKMVAVVNQQSFTGLPKELTPAVIRKHFPSCTACTHATLAQRPLPKESTTEYGVGECWEIDAKGPMTGADGKVTPSFSGAKHAINAICVRSKYVHCFLVKNLSKPSKYIQKLINICKHMKRTIKVIRCDDAYIKADIKELCLKNSIELQGCAPYEHGQIGHVERLHRTLIESVVKALYGKPHLSDEYWAMAWNDCVDKLNMTPHEELDDETPLYMWAGKKAVDARVTPLLPFGTIVAAHIPVSQQHALSGRTFEAFSVGIAPGYKGGITLFNPETKHYIVRRTFKQLGPVAPISPTYKMPIEYSTEFVDLPEKTLDVARYSADNHDLSQLEASEPLRAQCKPSSDALRGPSHSSTTAQPTPGAVPPSTLPTGSLFGPAPIVAKKSRVDNRVPSLLQTISTQMAMAARGTVPTVPLDVHIPNSWSAALASEHRDAWLAAARVETDRWKKMDVYEAVPADKISSIPKEKIINSTIVMDVKRTPLGLIERHKLRVCARGDQYLRNQKIYEVIKGDGTSALGFYAGTVKSESVKMLLGITAEEDLELETWDVSTAFLYPYLKPAEEIYLRRPKGFTDEQMPYLMRLKKCAYGLPQASQYFREHSDKALVDIGFKATISDPQVYTYREGSSYIYISTHVDDFGVISNSTSLMASVKAKLDKVYDLKVTESSSYLGMHIDRDRANRTIRLSQPKYIEDVLKRFKVRSDVTEYPATPMSIDLNWKPHNGDLLTGKQGVLCDAKRKLYMQKIGSLVYLAIMTRPDILYAVNMLSRFCKEPVQLHMDAVNRVLQYVAGTAHYTYNLHSGEGIILYATSDASYACHKDLKSHTGCTLHLGRHSASVHSLSKKQSITADSSTVAEFIAAHTCSKEIMWARNFLEELGFKQQNATVLFVDNQPAISLMTKSGSGFKTKHIALRYNFLREQIKNGVIQIKYLPSKEMNSDQLTKALGPSDFGLSFPLVLGKIGGEMAENSN